AAARMVARGAAIATHLQYVSPRRFRPLIGRVELAAYCLRDVTSGAYRRVPWKTVAALTAALAYFISPVDALPDFVPLTGFIDDAAVLALVFGAAEADLRRYCAWRGLDASQYFTPAGS
ncbi:MAG: YkvA family protein, partial [Candidatus Binatia bacterium]